MTVLVGYTPRPESEAALAAAAVEARLRSSKLHVLWSHPEPTTASGQRLRDWQDELDQVRKDAEALRARLEADGLDVATEVSGAPASNALIETAERIDAELMVIGLRRRSAVGKLVLGSVAQDVLLRAECAVLAIKHDDREPG